MFLFVKYLLDSVAKKLFLALLYKFLIRVHNLKMKKSWFLKSFQLFYLDVLIFLFYRKCLYLVNKLFVIIGDCSLSTEHVMSLINMLLICYFDTISFSYFIQSFMIHELIQDIWLYNLMHVISIYVRYKH